MRVKGKGKRKEKRKGKGQGQRKGKGKGKVRWKYLGFSWHHCTRENSDGCSWLVPGY